jgi:hypothetical protein
MFNPRPTAIENLPVCASFNCSKASKKFYLDSSAGNADTGIGNG